MKPSTDSKLRDVKFQALILVLLFILNSCIGVGMDITLNQNGSGTIEIEYNVSRSLDSLGKLDGNERWNTIPVGRADFMRTMDRIPGMKLLSFSSKESEKDFTVNAKMEFDDPRALMAFLDAGGRHSYFSGDASSGSLVLTLSEGKNSLQGKNDGLDRLISAISEQYQIRVSMSFPNEGSIVITNNLGISLPGLPEYEIIQSGKKVSLKLPLNAVLSSTEGIKAEFRW